MKLAVVGSRGYTNQSRMRQVFEKYIAQYGADNLTIVSGGCPKGADFLGKQIALEIGLLYEEHAPAHAKHNQHCVLPQDSYNKAYNVGNFFQRNTEVAKSCDHEVPQKKRDYSEVFLMIEKGKLLETCQKSLGQKGIDDETHNKRLMLEMKEIDAQNEHEYFLGLYEKKVRYSENQNNLLIPYLLGIVEQFNIAKQPAYVYGESPDIDVDFLPMIRDYLKQVWAPKEFGVDKVCNIGSYNTFGIKSSLINMARVFGKSRSEVLEITKQLDLKDDEGKTLTWDKALELYPDLKKYCENEDYKEVAEAARRLIGRNNSMGKHAGGLIISSTRIDNFVPLVKDKDGTPLSAWVEGLHGQDLGPMGLVKFDLLVITNLMQIALACKIIKERYKLTSICALPGQQDWSDVSYLDDPKSIDMANKGDLKCVFQFDSMGIRQMAKAGGVTSFDDLVAYTSLYRPGPLGMKMQERYIERKRGREPYEVHPILKPYLGVTYGVLVYQEQVMQILHVVGDIPLKDCEIARKAISKKKVELFSKFMEMFVINGQKNLGWDEEQVKNLWDQIACFAEYGFNRSHACAYTYISSRLLWLKAHYPLEFFAAILSCEDQSEKLKEYKLEAERHNVKIMPVDVNKSGVKFQIVGNTLSLDHDWIYFGLSNIKGVGEAVAQRIVDNQQYNSFTEFLTKFGTDAGVMKPLIGLRVFKEAAPVDLFKYYEWFKNAWKRRTDRTKRVEKRCEELTTSLKELLPPSLHEELAVFTTESLVKTHHILNSNEGWPNGECPNLDASIQWADEDGMVYFLYDDIAEIHKQYHRSVDNYNKKIEVNGDTPDRAEFNPESIEVDEELVRIYNSLEDSETAYYGFLWTHPLERSPDYAGGMTFETHRQDAMSHPINPVEVRIKQAEKTTAKNKKTEYYLLQLEDACGELQQCQVWMDDWERFGEDLIEGALVRIRVKAPDGGFRRYTMESFPRNKKHLTPKRKEDDIRVFVMRRGPEDERKVVAE